MISGFLESKQEYPTVGISFGLDRICMALKEKGLKISKTPTQVYLIPIKTEKECVDIARELRKQNIKVDMDMNGKGISKNLQYANSYEIPYVIFVGQEELKAKKVKLRNMKTGKEELLKVNDVKNKVK